MAEEGREYRGVLYVGLMLTERGPSVLEFNCRLGDPETQAILLRLDDNLAEVARCAADGRLESRTSPGGGGGGLRGAGGGGYPGMPRKGDVITGIETALGLPGLAVYHSGTQLVDGQLATAGGRVLSVCARAGDLTDAIALAYQGVGAIRFAGMQYRSDIGADTLAALGGGSGEPG